MAINQIEDFANYFSRHFSSLELFILSDPERSNNIKSLIKFAGAKNHIIMRNYGDNSLFDDAKNKRNILGTTSLKISRKYGLAGIHIPSSFKCRIVPLKRDEFITCAAHNIRQIIRANKINANAILISPIFPSESKSAKKPLGHIKLALLTRMFLNTKFIALGGINKKTAKRLGGIKLYGMAGVSFKI